MNKMKQNLFKKTKKNKQSSLGGPLVFIYSVLAFVFILIVFFILLKFQEVEEKEYITANIEDLCVNNLVTSYLKTEINYSNQKMTIGDLIIDLEQDLIRDLNEGNEKKCLNDIDPKKEMISESEKCKFLKKETKRIFENIPEVWVKVGYYPENEMIELEAISKNLLINNKYIPQKEQMKYGDFNYYKENQICSGNRLQLQDKEVKDIINTDYIIVWVCKSKTKK